MKSRGLGNTVLEVKKTTGGQSDVCATLLAMAVLSA